MYHRTHIRAIAVGILAGLSACIPAGTTTFADSDLPIDGAAATVSSAGGEMSRGADRPLVADRVNSDSSGSDTFYGRVNFAGKVVFTAPAGQLVPRPSTPIAPVAGSASIHPSTSDMYHVIAPAARVLNIVVKSTDPIPENGSEVTFGAYQIPPSHAVLLRNESGVVLVSFVGSQSITSGVVTFKFIGGQWLPKSVSYVHAP